MTATLSRRSFVGLLTAFPIFGLRALQSRDSPVVMTVTGPIAPGDMGVTLTHEHILVDFIGARLIDPERWNRDEVADRVLPFLDEVKSLGCRTFVDCTPNYLGRDVELLKQLSQTSGLNIITNTGYYGGSDHKFLPEHAFTDTAEQLAAKWVNEWKLGIEKTGVKPGLIKISVNAGTLSEISRKLIRAATLTHLRTGLTIASHTGPAVAAMEQIAILKKERVSPSAFIWVHAQNEKDTATHVEAARDGAWVSLDGLNDDNVEWYVEQLNHLKGEKCLDRTLVSHDAGWYKPGEPGGGDFRGYSALFTKLIPALRQAGFAQSDIDQLIRVNPMNALTIGVRRLKK